MTRMLAAVMARAGDGHGRGLHGHDHALASPNAVSCFVSAHALPAEEEAVQWRRKI